MKSAFNQLMSGMTAFEVLSAAPTSEPEQWVKLAPRGEFTARDGRTFNLDPEKMVKVFEKDGVSVPVDVDHAIPKRGARGDAAPAVGWIEHMQARPDGLYGKVKWLKEGLEILSARSHRYISPCFKAVEGGIVTWIHSAALVAAPAISMPAVASADPESTQELTPMQLKTLMRALGLSDTATFDDAISSILLLKKSASETEALSATFEGLSVGMSKELQEERKRRQENKVESAIASGAIPPALRDWAADLVSTDEGKFDAYCAKVGKPLAYLMTPMISREREAALSAEVQGRGSVASSGTAKVAQILGIDENKLL